MGTTEKILTELLGVEMELRDVQGICFFVLLCLLIMLPKFLRLLCIFACFFFSFYPSLCLWQKNVSFFRFPNMLWFFIVCDFLSSNCYVLWCCCSEQIKVLIDQQDRLYERQSELKALLEYKESDRSNGEDEASVSMENWSGTFEWDSAADDVRFNVFGISAYRANQREVGQNLSKHIWTLIVLKKECMQLFLWIICCLLNLSKLDELM